MSMPNYITKKELMSLLRISSTTFERWLKEDRLPKPIQISRVRLWEKDEILRTMEAFKAQHA
jgi:predicted DNA-binding transcriptional regulator AlpA